METTYFYFEINEFGYRRYQTPRMNGGNQNKSITKRKINCINNKNIKDNK